MSPTQASRNSDPRSENNFRTRGRPAFPRQLVLDAAEKLFADAGYGQAVSMDAVAAEAGIGKGTLFRAFGSRDGLLDALLEAKFAPIREAVRGEQPPLGTGTPPQTRIAAFLDAVLTFKLENRHVMRAREAASSSSLRTELYSWMHDLLQRLIEETAPAATASDPGYAAHVLLLMLHIDVVDELLDTERSPDDIRRAHIALTRAVLGDGPRE